MIHPKILETGLPFEFSIPLPSEAWVIETESRIQQAITDLEATMWLEAVGEYRRHELAAMTAKRYTSKLIAMLDEPEERC